MRSRLLRNVLFCVVVIAMLSSVAIAQCRYDYFAYPNRQYICDDYNQYYGSNPYRSGGSNAYNYGYTRILDFERVTDRGESRFERGGFSNGYDNYGGYYNDNYYDYETYSYDNSFENERQYVIETNNFGGNNYYDRQPYNYGGYGRSNSRYGGSSYGNQYGGSSYGGNSYGRPLGYGRGGRMLYGAY